jgi:diguanylate cyclase (GGDEF)-like protein
MSELNSLQEEDLARHEFQKAQIISISEPERALDHLRRAEKFDPKNHQVLVQLGRLLIRLNQIPEAVTNLERLRTMDRSNSDCLSLLSFGYCQRGYFDLAKETAAECLSIEPGNIISLEVMANCYASEKDFRACLRQLDKLMSSAVNDDLARISFKAAVCYLRLGLSSRALDMTATLIENGYDNIETCQVYNEAQDLVRAEIEKKLQHMTWLQRIFNRLADKALLHLHVDSTKGLESLRVRYEEVQSKYAEATNQVAQAQADTNQLNHRIVETIRLAHTDHLTSLPNRTCFEREWMPKIMSTKQCAFVAFDLDRFKLINDDYGHEAGDKTLVKAASIASSIFRCDDGNCFRIGGEEFLAVLFDDVKNVVRKTLQFQRELERRAAVELAADGLHLQWSDESGQRKNRNVTASVGIALWPQDDPDIVTALRLADQAAYAAKHRGRNRVVSWAWMDHEIESVQMPGTNESILA